MNSSGETEVRSSELSIRDARDRLQAVVAVARRAIGRQAREKAAKSLADTLLFSQCHLDASEVHDILGNFDYADFIFSYTHYDNCDNFHFYRRT